MTDVESNAQGDALLTDLKRFLPEGLTLNGWAVAAGVNRAVWGDIRKHGNPSRRTLGKLLGAAGSSLAEFEALRVGVVSPTSEVSGRLAEHGVGAWRGAGPQGLVLKETLAVGEEAGLSAMRIVGTSAEQVARPASLAGDEGAYTIVMADDAMWPRFRAGRRLVVSPGAEVREGDDVLARLVSGDVVVGELVVQNPDGWWLRQFMPDRTERLDGAAVVAVEKVLGEAI